MPKNITANEFKNILYHYYVNNKFNTCDTLKFGKRVVELQKQHKKAKITAEDSINMIISIFDQIALEIKGA